MVPLKHDFYFSTIFIWLMTASYNNLMEFIPKDKGVLSKAFAFFGRRREHADEGNSWFLKYGIYDK